MRTTSEGILKSNLRQCMLFIPKCEGISAKDDLENQVELLRFRSDSGQSLESLRRINSQLAQGSRPGKEF